MKSPLGL
jgi:hypothetical protein